MPVQETAWLAAGTQRKINFSKRILSAAAAAGRSYCAGIEKDSYVVILSVIVEVNNFPELKSKQGRQTVVWSNLS